MIRRPPRSTRMTHSFPTRRSSELGAHGDIGRGRRARRGRHGAQIVAHQRVDRGFLIGIPLELEVADIAIAARGERSEEHTSELQSLMRISYAVFCLKKTIKHTLIIQIKYHDSSNERKQREK